MPPRIKQNGSSATVGFETKLWPAADELRSNMDAVEYKHAVLRFIFLKYNSDAFEEDYAKLVEGKSDTLLPKLLSGEIRVGDAMGRMDGGDKGICFRKLVYK